MEKLGLLSKMLHDIRSKMVKPYVKGDVLDIGCGINLSNYKMSKDEIKDFVGVEYDEKVVERLKQKFQKLSFYRRDLDIDKLEIKKKFDTILIVAVIEHIFNQKHLMSEVAKHLKPKGKIIITTPTPFGNDWVLKYGSALGLFSSQAGHGDHIVVYNKDRFRVLANELGLKIEKYKTFELRCNQLVVLSKK
jgi:2-polyprenyl-3-methyl-5-hydroxy-6-metoxy-1,4-benzoquinol methylase